MKTALVLSGGGAKGAFQAGALQILHERAYAFNSVAGVSVGALNGIMVAANRVPRLLQIWKTITRKQVYAKQSIPLIALKFLAYKIGLSAAPRAVYSNEPLFNLLKQELDDVQLQIPLTIGRVNIETGDYISSINPQMPHFPKEVLASTAIPVIWRPVEINGKMFVDGGVRNTTPLKDAVMTHPDRIIIITNGPLNMMKNNRELTDIIDIAERTLDVLLDEIFRNDLWSCLQINNLVQQAEEQGITLRSKSGRPLKNFEVIIIAPPEPLGSALDFDRRRLDELLEMGKRAAKKSLKADR